MEKGAGGSASVDAKTLRRRISDLFLPVYVDRLAARTGDTRTFALADGRRGTVSTPSDVRLLLAMEIHESGGKDKARLTTLPLFLPVEPTSVESAFPGECLWTHAEEFDAAKGKVLREERLAFRGLILDRRESAPAKGANASDLLFEQVQRGEIEIPLDDEARQWLYRIQLARRVFPDMGLPALDEEEWDLIHHEICSGKTSAKQLLDVSVSAALKDYLGPTLVSFLEREAPTEVKLPQGKRGGKITYFENNPPEIAARLGDFLGMEGVFKILKGRVEVTYDILAPNYRTVQKTKDLSSFWKNSYPEVKKELKRRYPRHPWP
jgi:ATP-dependent helicase HrpB